MSTLEDYLNDLGHEIQASPEDTAEILREIRSHLELAVLDPGWNGQDETARLTSTLERFGAAADIGRELPEGASDLHGLPPEAAGDFPGFMKGQLTELLTNYGPIDLMWIDQYRNKYTLKQWPELRAAINALQPSCLVLGNNAPNLRDSDIVGYERPVLGKRTLADDKLRHNLQVPA